MKVYIYIYTYVALSPVCLIRLRCERLLRVPRALCPAHGLFAFVWFGLSSFKRGGLRVKPNPKPFRVSNGAYTPSLKFVRVSNGGLNQTRNPFRFKRGGVKPNPNSPIVWFGAVAAGLSSPLPTASLHNRTYTHMYIVCVCISLSLSLSLSL